jgi:hypothetical protein
MLTHWVEKDYIKGFEGYTLSGKKRIVGFNIKCKE